MLDDIRNSMTYDDLPNEDMQLVADTIGLEATLKLMEECGGMQITIPKNFAVKAKRKYIIDNQHIHAKKLAIRTGTSERYVYNVLNDFRSGRMEELLGED